MFEIKNTYYITIFTETYKPWIKNDALIKINIFEYLNDEAGMRDVALKFFPIFWWYYG